MSVELAPPSPQTTQHEVIKIGDDLYGLIATEGVGGTLVKLPKGKMPEGAEEIRSAIEDALRAQVEQGQGDPTEKEPMSPTPEAPQPERPQLNVHRTPDSEVQKNRAAADRTESDGASALKPELTPSGISLVPTVEEQAAQEAARNAKLQADAAGNQARGNALQQKLAERQAQATPNQVLTATAKAAGYDGTRRGFLKAALATLGGAGLIAAEEVATGGAGMKAVGTLVESLNKAGQGQPDATATRAPARATATSTAKPTETPRPSATATETEAPTDTPKPTATEKPSSIDTVLAEKAPKVEGATVVYATEVPYKKGTTLTIMDGSTKMNLKALEPGKRMFMDDSVGKQFFGGVIDFLQAGAVDGTRGVDMWMGKPTTQQVNVEDLTVVVVDEPADKTLNNTVFGQNNDAAIIKSGGWLFSPTTEYTGTQIANGAFFKYELQSDGRVVVYVGYQPKGDSVSDKKEASRFINLYISESLYHLGRILNNRGSIENDYNKYTVFLDTESGEYKDNGLKQNYWAIFGMENESGDVTP